MVSQRNNKTKDDTRFERRWKKECIDSITAACFLYHKTKVVVAAAAIHSPFHLFSYMFMLGRDRGRVIFTKNLIF